MKEVSYRTSGSLPASWEDFFAIDSHKNPHVTISGGEKCEVITDPEEGENGIWIDILTQKNPVSEEVAIEYLNKALKLFHKTKQDFNIEIIQLKQTETV